MLPPAHHGDPWTHVDLTDPANPDVVDGLSTTQIAAEAGTTSGPRTTAASGTVPTGTSHVPGLTTHVASDCSGTETGNTGNRVQVIYAHEQGRADRYATVLSSIKNVTADIDDAFAMSSPATDTSRRVRWAQDAYCSPKVIDLTLPAGSLGADPNPTFTAIRNAGYDAVNGKYLVFADYSTMLYNGNASGIAEFYQDDSATDNYNDGRGSLIARVDSWTLRTAGHELMHMLGAVENTAPHHTDNGHCTDGTEMMCYSDGSPQVYQSTVCGSGNWAYYDCNHDDYYNTNPATGSYLATHWNTARSSFLAVAAATTPPPTTTNPTPPPTTNPTPTPPPTKIHTKVKNKVHRGHTSTLTSVTLTSTGSHIAYVPVTLQARKPGSHRWVDVTTKETNGTGKAVARVHPRSLTYYRWILTDTTIYAGSASRAVFVRR